LRGEAIVAEIHGDEGERNGISLHIDDQRAEDKGSLAAVAVRLVAPVGRAATVRALGEIRAATVEPRKEAPARQEGI
jgi:hypothetical protein